MPSSGKIYYIDQDLKMFNVEHVFSNNQVNEWQAGRQADKQAKNSSKLKKMWG